MTTLREGGPFNQTDRSQPLAPAGATRDAKERSPRKERTAPRTGDSGRLLPAGKTPQAPSELTDVGPLTLSLSQPASGGGPRGGGGGGGGGGEAGSWQRPFRAGRRLHHRTQEEAAVWGQASWLREEAKLRSPGGGGSSGGSRHEGSRADSRPAAGRSQAGALGVPAAVTWLKPGRRDRSQTRACRAGGAGRVFPAVL